MGKFYVNFEKREREKQMQNKNNFINEIKSVLTSQLTLSNWNFKLKKKEEEKSLNNGVRSMRKGFLFCM